MGDTQETRLADARRREAEARARFEAAVAEVQANRSPAPGWKDAQAKASAALAALGEALGELDEAERAAGVRPPLPVPDDAGSKLLVALVRVPARAADAMRYGPGDFAGWIADALAVQYSSDFDADAGAPGNPWAVEVRARYGAGPEDAATFRGVCATVIDPAGETARAVAAALDSAGEG